MAQYSGRPLETPLFLTAEESLIIKLSRHGRSKRLDVAHIYGPVWFGLRQRNTALLQTITVDRIGSLEVEEADGSGGKSPPCPAVPSKQLAPVVKENRASRAASFH